MQVGQRNPQQRPFGAGQAHRCPADRPAQRAEQRQDRRRAAEEAQHQLWLAAAQQRQADNPGDAQPHRQRGIAPVASERRNPRAEQRHRRKAAGGQQRRRGKDQRDQQAIGRRAQQRPGIEGQPGGDRQQIAQRPGQQRGDQHPGGQPGQTAGERRCGDLEQIDPGDVTAGRAQHFQRRDAAAAGLEIGGYSAADSDPGDHQRGEANQDQEIAHPRDEPLGSGRGALAGAGLEAG